MVLELGESDSFSDPTEPSRTIARCTGEITNAPGVAKLTIQCTRDGNGVRDAIGLVVLRGDTRKRTTRIDAEIKIVDAQHIKLRIGRVELDRRGTIVPRGLEGAEFIDFTKS
jgi:hypothetical protein